MRRSIVLFTLVLICALAACGPRPPACPEPAEGFHFLTREEFALALEATPSAFSDPVEVVIGRKTIVVDKIVSGPLCNDQWRGTVYVTCDTRVAEWTEAKAPEFLKGCKLDVEPGTVVYVAAHYDTAYYEGCSCHTGEIHGSGAAGQ